MLQQVRNLFRRTVHFSLSDADSEFLFVVDRDVSGIALDAIDLEVG
jgi:hypothetical protein